MDRLGSRHLDALDLHLRDARAAHVLVAHVHGADLDVSGIDAARMHGARIELLDLHRAGRGRDDLDLAAGRAPVAGDDVAVVALLGPFLDAVPALLGDRRLAAAGLVRVHGVGV